MLSKRQFILKKETFSKVTEQIHDELSKTKANKKLGMSQKNSVICNSCRNTI